MARLEDLEVRYMKDGVRKLYVRTSVMTVMTVTTSVVMISIELTNNQLKISPKGLHGY